MLTYVGSFRHHHVSHSQEQSSRIQNQADIQSEDQRVRRERGFMAVQAEARAKFEKISDALSVSGMFRYICLTSSHTLIVYLNILLFR